MNIYNEPVVDMVFHYPDRTVTYPMYMTNYWDGPLSYAVEDDSLEVCVFDYYQVSKPHLPYVWMYVWYLGKYVDTEDYEGQTYESICRARGSVDVFVSDSESDFYYIGTIDAEELIRLTNL